MFIGIFGLFILGRWQRIPYKMQVLKLAGVIMGVELIAFVLIRLIEHYIKF
jgi:hypothetical protein